MRKLCAVTSLPGGMRFDEMTSSGTTGPDNVFLAALTPTDFRQRAPTVRRPATVDHRQQPKINIILLTGLAEVKIAGQGAMMAERVEMKR